MLAEHHARVTTALVCQFTISPHRFLLAMSRLPKEIGDRYRLSMLWPQTHGERLIETENSMAGQKTRELCKH
jgi:hypothetical protein